MKCFVGDKFVGDLPDEIGRTPSEYVQFWGPDIDEMHSSIYVAKKGCWGTDAVRHTTLIFESEDQFNYVKDKWVAK